MGAGEKLIANNPKARHDYSIDQTFEAGIALTGSEVKSLRGGGCSLREAFAVLRDSELFLVNMHIPPYAQAGYSQHEPRRTRKLLLNRYEIDRLIGKVKERGLTLVALRIYFLHGLVKVEIGLAKGKRKVDKRHDLAGKEAKRQMERAMKSRGRRGFE